MPPNEATEPQPRKVSGMDAATAKLILESLTELKQYSANSIAFQARVEEHLSTMDTKLDRVEKVLFGNGNPGLGEQLRAHEKRLCNIETKCTADQTREILDDVVERHAEEDKKAEKQEQATTQKAVDQRKLWYGIATMILTALVDIIVHFFK